MNDATSPIWRVLGLLGDNPRKSGSGYEVKCPAHDDRHASLSVGIGNDGRVLLNCHVGCAPDSILTSLGLGWGDLFERSERGNPVRRYKLIDPAGTIVAEHVREDLPNGSKQIRWEHNGKSGLNGTAVVELPLYGAGEIRKADLTLPVIVTEGEKAAQALSDAGLLAVATVTGADQTPSDNVLSVLSGREVWLWPDNDDVGRTHMERIAQRLTSSRVQWIEWKAAPPKGDAADFIERGGNPQLIKGLLAPPPPLAGPRIWRATELMAMRFDSVKWAIPGLLPAGLAIMAGRPKLGKSWLALGWGIDVAGGGKALRKMDTTIGDVLYMALEDGPQRIQERLALMLGEARPPERLSVATEWPRIGEGGLELLEQWLIAHPEARLVVVDTFKRIRPKEKNNQRLYDLDYDAIAPVAALARLHNVAIVVVMHTRKGESEDSLELVSGTLGLSGAADAVLVLKRERGQADASLFITGRDVEEQDLALRWEKEDVLGWALLGNADQFRKSRERQEITDAIASVPGMRPAEIADAIGKPRGNVRYLLFAMTRDAEVRVRDGKYYPGTNTPNTPSVVYIPNANTSPTPVTNTSTHRPVRAVSDLVKCRFCGLTNPSGEACVCGRR